MHAEKETPLECVLLQAIRDEILSRLGDKRCYYHYNPGACITGPILYFNWCSDHDHYYKHMRDTEVQIVLWDGGIYIVKDRQPSPQPENIIAKFDLAAPSFCVGDLTRALRRYYGPQNRDNPGRPVQAGCRRTG